MLPDVAVERHPYRGNDCCTPLIAICFPAQRAECVKEYVMKQQEVWCVMPRLAELQNSTNSLVQIFTLDRFMATTKLTCYYANEGKTSNRECARSARGRQWNSLEAYRYQATLRHTSVHTKKASNQRDRITLCCKHPYPAAERTSGSCRVKVYALTN